MECIIRKMTREDCDAAAHVIAVCWKETYQGIIPEEELNRTDEQTIAENSRKHFPEDNHQFVLETDGIIAGYMNAGLTDDKEYEHGDAGSKKLAEQIAAHKTMVALGVS